MPRLETLYRAAAAPRAMSALSAARRFAPEWGLVLGSGLRRAGGRLAVDGAAPSAEVPELPAPMVPGHAGRFAWGRLGGRRVVVARGRVHFTKGTRRRGHGGDPLPGRRAACGASFSPMPPAA